MNRSRYMADAEVNKEAGFEGIISNYGQTLLNVYLPYPCLGNVLGMAHEIC